MDFSPHVLGEMTDALKAQRSQRAIITPSKNKKRVHPSHRPPKMEESSDGEIMTKLKLYYFSIRRFLSMFVLALGSKTTTPLRSVLPRAVVMSGLSACLWKRSSFTTTQTFVPKYMLHVNNRPHRLSLEEGELTYGTVFVISGVVIFEPWLHSAFWSGRCYYDHTVWSMKWNYDVSCCVAYLGWPSNTAACVSFVLARIRTQKCQLTTIHRKYRTSRDWNPFRCKQQRKQTV